jgi:hypothetical protein
MCLILITVSIDSVHAVSEAPGSLLLPTQLHLLKTAKIVATRFIKCGDKEVLSSRGICLCFRARPGAIGLFTGAA